jgi:hypothetical protein
MKILETRKQINFMKKIAAIFALVFFATITVNAQSEKKEIASTTIQEPTIEDKAKADTKALRNFMDMDDKMAQSLTGLFAYKHRNLAAKDLSEAGKKDIYRIIDAKLKATFNNDQIISIQKEPGLYDKLIK